MAEGSADVRADKGPDDGPDGSAEFNAEFIGPDVRCSSVAINRDVRRARDARFDREQ